MVSRQGFKAKFQGMGSKHSWCRSGFLAHEEIDHGIPWKGEIINIKWELGFKSCKNRLVDFGQPIDQKFNSRSKSQPLQNVILISFCNETMYYLINEWKTNVLNEMIMSVCGLKTWLLNDFLTKKLNCLMHESNTLTNWNMITWCHMNQMGQAIWMKQW